MVAADRSRDPDLGSRALEGFFERDFEVVAQVAAAGIGLAAPAAAQAAEHLVENIGETGGEAEIAGPARARPAAVFEGGMAEPVIGCALLIVLEDVVGLADFLEFVFGRLVARVAVRVILHG